MAVAAPSRPNLTRQSALESARRTYRVVADRAAAAAPDRIPYISGLWATWDGRLADLARFTGSTVPDHVQTVLDHLERAIETADDPESLLEWIDAYPDAIADLFPPSAATFTRLRGEDQPATTAPARRRAANAA